MENESEPHETGKENEESKPQEMNRQERREIRRRLRKERKEEARREQKSQSRKNTYKALGIAVIVVALIALGGFAFSNITGSAVGAPGLYDEFAQCTADAGLTMYGAYWCPHCQRQKLNFGSSFKYVDYVECDAGDPEGKGQPTLCQEMGIESYPTWIFEGQKYFGEQSLQQLAQITGCEL